MYHEILYEKKLDLENLYLFIFELKKTITATTVLLISMIKEELLVPSGEGRFLFIDGGLF